ncbi:hypothetical protein [Rhodopseudomonas palustris]|uniref:Uncharacterized protein n=1 Tax=Rhodopseudomonas palustris (strain BisB18) TaxID=316056 RepID=Q213H1_RHOPB
MRLAPMRNSIDHATTGGRLLRRVRAWFAAGIPACEVAPGEPREVEPRSVVPETVGVDDTKSAILLPFPIHGEALLVKLADLLRDRVANRASARDGFLLTVSRTPHSRLLIDDASYVEFHAHRSMYHLVVEAGLDTTVMLDTTDFDTLVQFVVQYINGRLSDSTALEVAS